MDVYIGIGIVVVVLWVWIVREIVNAPEDPDDDTHASGPYDNWHPDRDID